jgi:uncharacterized protein YlxW (UPF0749 family)
MFSNKKEIKISTEKSSKRDLISSEIKSLGKIKEDLVLEISRLEKETKEYNDVSSKNDEEIEHILELQNPKKVLGSGIIAYQ